MMRSETAKISRGPNSVRKYDRRETGAKVRKRDRWIILSTSSTVVHVMYELADQHQQSFEHAH